MAGSAEYTVAVVVTPEPPIPPNINITSQLESDIITFGSSLILDCIVTGTPQPVVTWMKDGVSKTLQLVHLNSLSLSHFRWC